MRKILGIDPGLKTTGWGIITQQGSTLRYVASGTLDTRPSDLTAVRLAQLSRQMHEIVQHHKPDTAAIEDSFVNQNPMSSLKLGQARGALIAIVALAQVPVAEYPPRLVKKAVTGVGGAEKEQVMAMMRVLFPGIALKKADEADALAIAVCHAHHAAFPAAAVG